MSSSRLRRAQDLDGIAHDRQIRSARELGPHASDRRRAFQHEQVVACIERKRNRLREVGGGRREANQLAVAGRSPIRPPGPAGIPAVIGHGWIAAAADGSGSVPSPSSCSQGTPSPIARRPT